MLNKRIINLFFATTSITYINIYRYVAENVFEHYNVIMIILVAWLGFMLVSSGKKYTNITLIILILLYSFFIFIITYINNYENIGYAVNMIIILITFLVLLPLQKLRINDIKIILYMYLVLGCLLATISLINNYKLLNSIISFNTISIHSLIPVIGNKNADASLLSFSILSTFILRILNSRRSHFYNAILIFQIFVLLTMLSRTPLLSLFTAFFIYSSHAITFKRKFLIFLVSIIVLILISQSNYLIETFIRPSYGLSERDILWLEAINIIKENIFIGIGFNNWLDITGFDALAHNLYLQIIIDIGILGFLFFLTVLLYIIHICKPSINKTNNIINRKLNIATYSIVFFILVYSFFEANYIGGYRAVEINSIFFISLSLIVKNSLENTYASR